jgi:hypothetical protein
MPTEHLTDRVRELRELREQGRTSTEIAGTLGVPGSAVAPMIRAIGPTRAASAPAGAIVGCWVNAGWASGLTIDSRAHWPGIDETADPGTAGLVTVAVARERGRSKVRASSFLVDVFCLGVRRAIGPHALDRRKIPQFVDRCFGSYGAPPWPAPLELAQHLVFGATAYACSLGFEPAPGFDAVGGQLGPWQGPSPIGFGRDGRPLFIPGPYDDADSIVRTLERSTGQGNFDVLALAQQQPADSPRQARARPAT